MQEVSAQLTPPRKHYTWYYSTVEAKNEMAPREGLHDFLRECFHLKSADANNNPHPLDSMAATELAKLPHYYVMPKELGMGENIAQDMTKEEVANMREKSSRWFLDSDLEIYVNEFARTGFQGGLNWYSVMTDLKLQTDVDVFAGKKIEVPILLISGTKDYLIYQTPGALEKMEQACSDFRGISWVEGAGHWPQQEQPEAVIEQIINFLTE